MVSDEKLNNLYLGLSFLNEYFRLSLNLASKDFEYYSKLTMEIYHFRRLLMTEILYYQEQGIDGQIVTSLQDCYKQLVNLSSQLVWKGDYSLVGESYSQKT
jgi:hypothetical protein